MRFEKSSPAKVPEPQPLEDSWRFLGLGRERAQFFGGVVAEGQEEGVDQSQRKADTSSLAGVGALQGKRVKRILCGCLALQDA